MGRYLISKMDELQSSNSAAEYCQQREERCRKILNSSYINLEQKLRDGNQYCSVDK